MANVSALTVQGRDRAGKGAARATRREGLVPGVIYGDSKEPVLISMKPRDLFVEMHKPGFATQIFEITVGKDTQRAMAQDVQMHPVRDTPVHVDFRRIGKNTVVNVAIPVQIINEEASPGIKGGGVINMVRHEIEVRARPDALPESFEIDLTGLEIGDSVHISAITMPEGVAPTITDRDFTVITLAAPTVATAAEDEEDAAAAEGEAAEGEDAEGDKKEESGD